MGKIIKDFERLERDKLKLEHLKVDCNALQQVVTRILSLDLKGYGFRFHTSARFLWGLGKLSKYIALSTEGLKLKSIEVALDAWKQDELEKGWVFKEVKEKSSENPQKKQAHCKYGQFISQGLSGLSIYITTNG